MHKRLFNEAIIELSVIPTGPILIKAGEGASDPTKPDMSFVRTVREGRETVYLPGSSLKGVIRAYCERLARTVDSKQRRQRKGKPLACDPLDEHDACGRWLDKAENRKLPAAVKHDRSCFVCQLFGNTSIASHFRIADAYPAGECRREERNGVAIDRVFGSVAVGPFNYETVTSGDFRTTLHVKNFTLAQLGLLMLTLRDLTAKRVRIGFAKSRGLGAIAARVGALVLRYPLCELYGEQLRMLGNPTPLSKDELYGVGFFAHDDEDKHYGYPMRDADRIPLPGGYGYESDGWLGVEVSAPRRRDGEAEWQSLGRACVPRWKAEVEDAGGS